MNTNTLHVQYIYTSASWIVPIALKMLYDVGLWDIKQRFLAKSSVWTMRGAMLLTIVLEQNTYDEVDRK